MLMLRLARAGSKKRPVYHLVAADRRARRDGRFIENLGYYMPTRDIMVLKYDRIDHWLSVGAQPTDTAKSLIKKGRRHGNQEPTPKVRPAPAAKPATETPAPAAKKAAATPEASASASDTPAPEGDAPADAQ